MTVVLKSCPFCKGKAELSCGSPGCWFVHCLQCKAATDDVSRDRAIELWNTRPSVDEQLEGYCVTIASYESDRKMAKEAAMRMGSELEQMRKSIDLVLRAAPKPDSPGERNFVAYATHMLESARRNSA